MSAPASVFEYFEKIASTAWSGEVEVTSSQGHAHLLIQNGQLIWAHRPLDHALERFKKIPWLELPENEVLSQAKSWDQLVQTVISHNTEQSAALLKHLKTDRLEVFFRLFFWNNIEMKPRPFQVQSPEEMDLGFYSLKSLESLIAEAKRRLHEWPSIKERVGSSRRIFISQVELPDMEPKELDIIDKSLLQFEAGSSISDRSSMPFSKEEVEVIRLCDGRHSVQDIIRLTLDGEFLILRRVLALWDKGAIRPKDNEDSRSEKSTPQIVKRMKIHDLMGTILSAAAVIVLFMALQHVSSPLPPMDSSETLQTALNIYHVKNGRYPVTLTELLATDLIHEQTIEQWDYTLVHSHLYELRPKGK